MIKNKARFSRSTTRKKGKNIFKKVLLISIPIVFVCLLVYLVRLPSIQISEIKVSGNTSLSEDDIKNALLELTSGNKLLFIPKSNLFLINESYLESQILVEFQSVQKIKIKTSGNSTMLVEIVERTPIAIWCRDTSQSDCFFIDSVGIVFEPIKTKEDLNDKIFFYTSLEGSVLGKAIAKETQIQNFFKAIEFLSHNGVSVLSINLVSTDKLNVQTNIGRISLNPEEKNIEEILENVLLLVEKEREKKEGAVFEYLDARFGNKIFYKLSI